MTELAEIKEVGALGVFRDPAPRSLPKNAWTDANNIRFYKKNAIRILGHTQVFGTPTVAPGFVFNVPATSQSFWIYCSLTKAYVYDAGVHTDITRAAGGDYNAGEYRNWNGCILGGVPVLNNGVDIPQYWTGLSAGNDLANLSNWTATLRCKVIRNLGPYLVALNLTDNGTPLPHTFQWSHPADPGAVPSSWDYTDPTVDAGRAHLTDAKSGPILDALLLGDELMIYKQGATHVLRFVGGQSVLAPRLLLGSGILAPRCVCMFDGGTKHFVVAQDDVLVHAGSKTVAYPLAEKDKDYLFADIDPTNYLNAFAFDNPAFREVWFVYPSQGQTVPDKVLIWSYQYNLVKFRSWDGALSADIGDYTDSSAVAWSALVGSWDEQTFTWSNQSRRRLIYGNATASKLYGLDSGYAFGATTPTAYLERTGLVLEKDGYPIRKLCKRVWLQIRGDATVSVRMGAQEELDSAVTWQSPKIFDASQKYLDFEAVGRLPAIRIESADNNAWQLEGYDIEWEPIGVL